MSSFGKEKYNIKYDLYLHSGVLKCKEMIVSNCMGELHAKVKLVDYLKSKYSDYKDIVVCSCGVHDDMLSDFADLFGDGSSNPFSNFK